eukprot:8736210-Alexandrium_andersonii.AAC.1
MSASLVGSEMCIRDSSSILALDLAPAPQLRPCLHPRLLPCGHPCRPVSYTHLTLPTICSV